jgi:putative ABC transport system permease protein
MLRITLRDLQFRKRQFAIAIIGAGLVFALALLLTGVSAGFKTEAQKTVDRIGATAWVVQKGVTGPFTSSSAMPATTARKLTRKSGVRRADPFVVLPQTMHRGSELVTINVNGVVPGGLGSPEPNDGRPLAGPGEAVVDEKAGADLGSSFSIAGERYRAVGTVKGHTYNAGQPVVYLTVRDAQRLAFNGRPLASAVLVSGSLQHLPAGLVGLSNDQVRDDMLRPLKGARQAINLLRELMWIVAAVIIGAVVYLSALERLTDFAVLKAVGGESGSLAFAVSMQAIFASLVSAVLAAGFAAVLRPAFPLPITIGSGSYAGMVVVAAVVGVLASLMALRKVLKVDPALAFS